MLDIYRKLRDLLDARERRNAVVLFGLMFVMGLTETVGVASVMPFVSIVANPDVIHENSWLSSAYSYFGFSSNGDFLIFAGVIVFVLVVGSLAIRACTHWAIARYTNMRNYTLSCRLLRSYLDRPYSFFLNRHSADLGKSVLLEVGQVVSNVLMPGLQLAANVIVTTFLLTLVILVDPVVALTAAAILGGAFATIYLLLRRYLAWSGKDRIQANLQRFQIAQEALGGIKDVKVLSLESAYLDSFRKPAYRYAKHHATNQIIGEIPSFALQALVFGGMLGLLLALLATRGGDLGAVLPLIALYALAGSRLLGSMQKLYSSLTKMRFGQAALDSLHQDFAFKGITTTVDAVQEARPEPIRMEDRLELRDIRYAYPRAERPAVDGLSLTIQANTTVALVGATGAGKTTVADLILGLVHPQIGCILADGTQITVANTRAWQRSLGYVSQHIFLTDDSVTGNIAFGVPPGEVDHDAVRRAATIAELHEFVMNEMPDGYATTVGERGVRLSGGQRQRIGIARALYHDPDVLVLDEATSALDNLTEKAVMDAVHNLSHRKTIIIIAHRLSTVRGCDCIFLLEHGRLLASGRYDELIARSEGFRAMAGATASTGTR